MVDKNIIIVDPKDDIPLIVTDCDFYPRDAKLTFAFLQERKMKSNMSKMLDELRNLFKGDETG